MAEVATDLALSLVLGFVAVAALILSIINFYFEQLKGAKITAFAWQVSHELRANGMGATIGYFAFTNEGSRTGIIRAVFVRLPTTETYKMQITAGIGQKGFPIALTPQQTELRVLYADYPAATKLSQCDFEYEMYPKKTGKIEIDPKDK